MARIQFILKARDQIYIGENAPDPTKKEYLSSGLLNSASFVVDMLKSLGHTVQLDHAIDNNFIDALVTKFKPDIVFIEAYYVVPEKFEILHKLHPKIKWCLRCHSCLPFAAQEGIFCDWSLRYMDYKNVYLACNDPRTNKEMQDVISVYKPEWDTETLHSRVFYLPNYYAANYTPSGHVLSDTEFNISCFGALRPLKNHLSQAVAAIQLAKKHNKHLKFHINGTRVEMNGSPVLHNIQKMFKLLPYELIEHPWMPHDEFCEVLKTMDISLQVSYTETFNIVTADAVVNGVPVVVGPDILWSDPECHADPNSTVSILDAMERQLVRYQNNTHWQGNIKGLNDYSANSQVIWAKYIELLK